MQLAIISLFLIKLYKTTHTTKRSTSHNNWFSGSMPPSSCLVIILFASHKNKNFLKKFYKSKFYEYTL